MISLLNVVAVYQAVRYVRELCREAKQYPEPIVFSDLPTEAASELKATETVVDETVLKGNTPDVYLIVTGECAGFIPGQDEQGSIPDAAEGEPHRKSTGRTGVDKDCSTGSPIMEQPHPGKKPRASKKRTRLRQTIPRFTIVEPTLVNVEFR